MEWPSEVSDEIVESRMRIADGTDDDEPARFNTQGVRSHINRNGPSVVAVELWVFADSRQAAADSLHAEEIGQNVVCRVDQAQRQLPSSRAIK